MKKKLLGIFAVMTSLLFVQCYSFAADNTEAEDAAELLNNIGVELPNKTDFDSFITRGECISSIVQLLNIDFPNDAELPFSDVSKESGISGALSYAIERGIISRGENFYPDREVTYNEAYKMAAAFLGRGMEADIKGGYPNGYDIVAENERLNKNLSDVDGGKLTVRDLYVLLRNIGDAKVVKQNFLSDKYSDYIEGDTIFSEYFDLIKISGIVTANSDTSLYYANSRDDNYININDDEFYYTGSCTLGTYVEGYARDSSKGDEKEAVFIKEKRNAIKDINFKDMVSASENVLFYDTERRNQKITIDENCAFIYNGKASNKTKISDIIKKKNGYVKFIDNNRDSEYDVAIINEYYVMYIDALNYYDKCIVDKNGAPKLDLSNNSVKYHIFDNDMEIELDSLKKNNLIEVYKSEDGLLVKIDTCNNVIIGTCKAMSDKYISIDGAEYEYSEYFKKNFLQNTIIGTEGEFILSNDGIVQVISVAGESQIQYGYVIKTWRDDSEEEYFVKIFTEKNMLKTYKLAEKVRYNDSVSKKNVLFDNVVLKSELIRFNTDTDGNLKMIDTANRTGRINGSENQNDRLSVYKWPANVSMTSHPWFTDTARAYVPYFSLGATSKVFVVNETEGISDDKKCTIMDANYIYSHQSTVRWTAEQIRAYDVTENGIAMVILLVDNNAKGEWKTASSSSQNGVVYSVYEAINDDDELTYEIVVYSDSKFSKLYLSTDILNSEESFVDSQGNTYVSRGDAISYDVSSLTGEITNIHCDYDYDTQKAEVSTTNFSDKHALYFGKVYSCDGSNITIIPEGISSITPSVDDDTARFSFGISGKVYVVDSRARNMYQADENDILSYRQVGDDCSNVFIRTDDGRLTFAVIYK